jgi:hypothetical protein
MLALALALLARLSKSLRIITPLGRGVMIRDND